jgi:hypothetical protein
MVDVCGTTIFSGLALIEHFGSGPGLTFTVAVSDCEPPGPVQVSVYVSFPRASGDADCDPPVADLDPFQLFSAGDAEAVHESAFVTVHVSVVEPYKLMVPGAAVKSTEGPTGPEAEIVTIFEGTALPEGCDMPETVIFALHAPETVTFSVFEDP